MGGGGGKDKLENLFVCCRGCPFFWRPFNRGLPEESFIKELGKNVN